MNKLGLLTILALATYLTIGAQNSNSAAYRDVTLRRNRDTAASLIATSPVSIQCAGKDDTMAILAAVKAANGGRW
jgi:hypothetical protein